MQVFAGTPVIKTQFTSRIETSRRITSQKVEKALPREGSNSAEKLRFGCHFVGEPGNSGG